MKSSREVEAMELLFEMRGFRIESNEFSFIGALADSVRLAGMDLGFQVQSWTIKTWAMYAIHFCFGCVYGTIWQVWVFEFCPFNCLMKCLKRHSILGFFGAVQHGLLGFYFNN